MTEVGIEIAAAGKSNRMREYITDLGYPDGFPKFLLPTGGPNHETLLGRVLRQAIDTPVPGPINIHTTPENDAYIQREPDVAMYIDGEEVRTTYVEHGNSFRPFLPKLLKDRVPVLGSSGDFYADFSWADVLDAHAASSFPVTFVVGQTIEVDRGAIFEVADSGQVTGFERTERTRSSDLLNVGIYVFEPTKPVINALSTLVTERHMAKEEDIVTKLVNNGLMGAYVLDSTPYNVNSEETYKALLSHTNAEVSAA